LNAANSADKCGMSVVLQKVSESHYYGTRALASGTVPSWTRVDGRMLFIYDGLRQNLTRPIYDLSNRDRFLISLHLPVRGFNSARMVLNGVFY
jgi:hypothetical protein